MKPLWFLPALIAPVLLAACAGQPSAPAPVPVYYDGRIKPELLQELGRIRISPEVAHPALTRYASIGSSLPYYGMLLPDHAGRTQAPFGEIAIDPVMDIAATTVGEFRQLLADRAALAPRFAPDGKARLQIEIIRVSIFAKDVGNSVCEPLVLMRAILVDAAGRPRWSSGITGNRPDDRIGYPCQDIEHKREIAAKALGAAVHTAAAYVVARM